MKIRSGMFVAILAMVLVLAACGGKEAAPSHDGHAAGGDLREKTASADKLPAFLKNQPDELRIVYQAAGKASDILQWMPCYCGCGDSVGHQSNLNCFIHEIHADGSVTWDDHGTRCGVCVQIAVTSIKLKQEGKSLKEIRDMIDETYKKGYAKPTKTPMPA